jgi:hypothetical protein
MTPASRFVVGRGWNGQFLHLQLLRKKPQFFESCDMTGGYIVSNDILLLLQTI